MQALLDAAAGRLTVEDIKRMLADHTGRPELLCRHASTPRERETASAQIPEPTSRTLHPSYGPPSEGSFATYRIT